MAGLYKIDMHPIGSRRPSNGFNPAFSLKEGESMSTLIIGLLIVVLLALLFLMFWIVVLSAALLIFGRKKEGKTRLLTEAPRTD
jgi:hypothetical protein